jgi:hypothetical protein
LWKRVWIKRVLEGYCWGKRGDWWGLRERDGFGWRREIRETNVAAILCCVCLNSDTVFKGVCVSVSYITIYNGSLYQIFFLYIYQNLCVCKLLKTGPDRQLNRELGLSPVRATLKTVPCGNRIKTGAEPRSDLLNLEPVRKSVQWSVRFWLPKCFLQKGKRKKNMHGQCK